MKIDDVSVPTERFVARVSAFVDTGDNRLGRAPFLQTPTSNSLLVAVPLRVTQSATSAPSSAQGADPAVIADPAVFASSRPGLRAISLLLGTPEVLPSSSRISTRARRETAAADGAVQSAVDSGLGPRKGISFTFLSSRCPTACSALATSLCRRHHPTSVPTAPDPSDRDRVDPLSDRCSGLPVPSRPPYALTTDWNALGASVEFHFGAFAARFLPAHWERE